MTGPAPDLVPDPEEVARIERIMLRLPATTLAIFIARRFHGLSIAEISRQTGLSHRQIMRHLSRAVAHLHEALRDR
jgi:DNA-directed RNA polymerase specialized sigma24 family protein